jgi:hypothetical protein
MNRLVLLPVDPYLIYAYWDLPAGLPPVTGARPILRLYESAAEGRSSRPFDIDVDLAGGHTDIHLWSPSHRYHADLGLRRPDGTLLVLAHSNRVQAPPPCPSEADPARVAIPRPAVTVPFARQPEPAEYPDLTGYAQERFLPGLPSSPGGAHAG